ncbi:hypothetical protein [Tessaracoccus sp. Y1736]
MTSFVLPPVKRLIIGNSTDPHITAVAAQLPRSGTVIVDASTLDHTLVELSGTAVILRDLADHLVVLNQFGARGWLRRLSPAGSDAGIVMGTQSAAKLAARLALLGSLVRDRHIRWLSDPSAVFAAENKITQYQIARLAGVPVPEWQVATSRDALARFGSSMVLKPLGPGSFRSVDGEDRVVFATEVAPGSLPTGNLLESPHLAQEKVRARLHLRVVTVNDHAWCAQLPADELTLDWRRDPDSHSGFVRATCWPEVESAAVKVAAAMSVGYSSQDWMVDEDGVPRFIDLNPGGQWLFLPDDLTDAVGHAISDWLVGGSPCQ